MGLYILDLNRDEVFFCSKSMILITLLCMIITWM